MSGYLLAPEAEDDIFQIWCYLVVEAGLQAADRFEAKLFETFENLVKNPHLGHKRSDLTKFAVTVFSVTSVLVYDCLPPGKPDPYYWRSSWKSRH
jgi:plasmid stabilization system protein ParE